MRATSKATKKAAERGSVGMPAYLYLHRFGDLVESAFGTQCYQVGSSLKSKTWRDVDVRLILPDAEYARMGFGPPEDCYQSDRWVALVLAFSALGKEMTGLPIDFQIQQQSYANAKFAGERNCLAFVPHRFAGWRPFSLDPDVPA